VCRLLRPSATWDGGQLEDLMDRVQDVEPRVEKYLQSLRHAIQPRADVADMGVTRKIASGETTKSDIKDSEDHGRDRSHGKKLGGIEIEDDIEPDALEYADNESSASDSPDDEPKRHAQSLTKHTISWLVNSVSFHNFRYNMSRYLFPCLAYVQEVLQSALRTPELCSATFHIEWELLRYTRSEIEDNQMLSTVLTVSGGFVDAEASTCLEYCSRTWPATGEFVTRVLEKAIKDGWHRKYNIPLTQHSD